MASINQATVIGFLGDNPKVNVTQSGRKVASFSVATTEKGYTTQSGATIPDRTEWHNIVLWGKIAEVAERYLVKGSSVFVQGKMRTRSYEDKNGIKRYITEIEGEQMQMLDRRQDNPANQQQGYPQQGGYQDDRAGNYGQVNPTGGWSAPRPQQRDDNDLPF